MINDELNWESIHEPAAPDEIGSIRVSEEFGIISIYTKVAEGRWHTVYLDPRLGKRLIPYRTVSDAVAGNYRLVFSPKQVG